MSAFRTHWIKRQAHYRLIGSLCLECGLPEFPPRVCCTHCAAEGHPALSSLVFLPAQPVSDDAPLANVEAALL